MKMIMLGQEDSLDMDIPFQDQVNNLTKSADPIQQSNNLVEQILPATIVYDLAGKP